MSGISFSQFGYFRVQISPVQHRPVEFDTALPGPVGLVETFKPGKCHCPEVPDPGVRLIQFGQYVQCAVVIRKGSQGESGVIVPL